MNIIKMHNTIRTLLDEHRTVRWESDDIDDIINFVTREIINESISPDGKPIKNKFEAVGKIRNELYPILRTSEIAVCLADGDSSDPDYNIFQGLEIELFPDDLRQVLRVSGYFHKLNTLLKTSTTTGVTDGDTSTTIADTGHADSFDGVTAGDLFYSEGRIYIIDAVLSAQSIRLKTFANDEVIVSSDYTIYSGDSIYLDGIDYVSRNEYTDKIKNDPFQKPDLTVYPRRMYYYIDDMGLRFTCEDIDYLPGQIYFDYIKEVADVYGGVEYGPETDAGATLPVIAAQDYIAVVESEYDPTAAGSNVIYQPNEEFVSSGGEIIYGVVAHDFVNSELPDSIHEEIVKRAATLLGTIPDRASMLQILNA